MANKETVLVLVLTVLLSKKSLIDDQQRFKLEMCLS